MVPSQKEESSSESDRVAQSGLRPGASDIRESGIREERSSGTLPHLPSRYELRQELGRGGMGAVYRAYDRTAGHEVALKVLHGVSAEDRLRLKNEFRALSDIVHPNLVVLHDLVMDEEGCFFTMEFLRGHDFATHAGQLRETCADPEQLQERFRDLARQLAFAVDALHQGNKLHRDIKPSNVLVTDAGRVVLLDFGLASSATRQAPGSGHTGELSSDQLGGTLLYMAPEQFSGTLPSTASDWYSFGATLYEAVVGNLSERIEMVRAKGPLSLRKRGFSIPEDLDDLIVRLLRNDPKDRPDSNTILRCLGRGSTAEIAPASLLPLFPAPELIGREALLAQLHQLLDSGSRTRTVRLSGPSGIGKSSLMRAFFDRLRTQSRRLLLKSRCHPQEALVFNALDGMIDELSNELAHGGLDAEARRLQAAQYDAVTQVFPVLAKALTTELAEPLPHVNDREKRLLAFTAIRELLRRASERWRIVVWLDDVQWADQDSGMLLRDLLRAPESPNMLLVLSYRAEDEHTSPCLQVLREDEDLWSATTALRVSPLDERESVELVGRLVGDNWPGNQAARDDLIRSAAGSPFLLTELGRYLSTNPAGAAARTSSVGLDEILRVRTQGLSSDARTVLEVLAVAGAPLEQETTLFAANLASAERGLLTNLERLSILRTVEVKSRRVEFYHDKLREEVMRQITGEAQKQHHRAIARALLGSSSPNPLAALDHFEAAEDLELVRRYVVPAANHALNLLAFERAARLYRRAIELESTDVPLHELHRRVGSALGSAGRGKEAAIAFSTAARLIKQDPAAAPEAAARLQQSAAEQFIQSGHFQEGTEVIRAVLAEFGVDLPKSRGEALRKAAGLRLLALASAVLPKRTRSEPASEFAIRRFDALWSANTRLAMVDYALCSYATARCARDALRLGDPSRTSRAVGMEAAFCSTLRLPIFQRRALSLLEQAEALARDQRATEYDAIFALSIRAIISFYRGQFRDTWQCADRALERLHHHQHGSTWEDPPWQMWSLIGLALNGEIKELVRRVRSAGEDAALREDRYIEQNISLGPPSIAWLAMDRADEALHKADRALGWAPSAYTVQHYQHYVTTVDCDLYRGEALSAWERTVRTWPAHERESFLMVTFVGDDLMRTRGRSALAAALALKRLGLARTRSGHDRGQLLKIAKLSVRSMSGHRLTSARGFAELLAAGLASSAGRAGESQQHLAAAATAFEAAEMRLFHEVARYCAGRLRAGTAGRRELARAEAWMQEQGVAAPEKIVASLAPGVIGE